MVPPHYFYQDTISRRIANQGQRGSLSLWDETIPRWISTQYFLVSGKFIIIIIIIFIIYIIIITFYIFSSHYLALFNAFLIYFTFTLTFFKFIFGNASSDTVNKIWQTVNQLLASDW